MSKPDSEMTAESKAIEKWNARADSFNKWPDIAQDEKDALISVEAEAMKEDNDAE